MATEVTFNATVTGGGEDTASLSMVARRHKTYDPAVLGGGYDRYEIVTQPLNGRAVVQDSDNTIVINMDGSTREAFTDTMTFNGFVGATPTLIELAITCDFAWQALPWGEMAQFIHPLDMTTEKWTLLSGEGHLDWYIDSVAPVFDVADINGGSFDGDFLIANNDLYGGSEGTSISVDVAIILHPDIPDQHHSTFHLKRNGDYTALQERFGKRGLSAMYPSTITSYGTGERPIMRGRGNTALKAGYTIHEDVQIVGSIGSNGGGACMAVNRCKFSEKETTVQVTPYYTQMNCQVRNVIRPEPDNSALDWSSAKSNRKSGVFLADSNGSCMYWNFYYHCGWDDTYLASGEYNAGANGQPPSTYSHNIYTQGDLQHSVMWGNITTLAASMGIQYRAGGLDAYQFAFQNPFGANTLGQGDPSKEPGNGPFNLTYRTLTTQGFEHNPSMVPLYGDNAGAQQRGTNWASRQSAVLQSMTVHNSDPNDAGDTNTPDKFGIIRDLSEPNLIDPKAGGAGDFYPGGTWLVYRWNEPDTDSNPGTIPDNSAGINTTVMDQITLQTWTDTVLSTTGTTGSAALQTHLLGLESYIGFAEDTAHYFIDGANSAGLSGWDRGATRTIAQVVTAVLDPGGRTSGKWWVIPEDWDTNDYPGFVDGDSADLQGHRGWWISRPKAMVLNNMTMGEGGGFTVGSSQVQITGTLSAVTTGSIGTKTCGRLLFNGYSGAAQITATTAGGLLVNEGTIAGNMDINVQGYDLTGDKLATATANTGFAMLCTGGQSVTFGAGDKLTVGGFGLAAIDGQSGTATINFNAASTLAFTVDVSPVANVNNPAKLGVLREFQTGLYGALPPAIASVVNLNDTLVELDLTGLAANDYTVLEVDTLNGALGTVTLLGGSGSIAKVGNTLVVTVT